MNVLASWLEWAAVAALTIALALFVGLPDDAVANELVGFLFGAFIAAFLVVFVVSQVYRRLA